MTEEAADRAAVSNTEELLAGPSNQILQTGFDQ